MRADILKRVHLAERRHEAKQRGPLVIVIQVVEPTGKYEETAQYECRETGHTWNRRNNESLRQFVDRVEQEGHKLAAETGALSIMLTPADLSGPK